MYGEQLGLADTEGGEHEELKCSEKTKRILKGIFCTIIILMSWIGILYLLKICFNIHQAQHIPDHNINNNDVSEEISDSPSSSSSSSNIDHTNNSTQSNTLATLSSIISNNNESIVIFDSPFFVTWYFATWNILYFPLYIFGYMIFANKTDKASCRKLIGESIQQFVESGFTAVQFLGRCGFFCVLWMLTNYMLIYPMRKLDATVVIALFSCTVSIVYLLSWVVLHHQFVGVRIVAVIICDTGLAMLAYMDGVQQNTKLGPVGLAFGAAIGAAIYKVFYKKMIGYTTYSQMALFFTLIGLINTFLMWPIVLLLYFTGLETLYWTQIPWLPLTGAAALNLLANFLGYFGVEWTYDVFLSLGIVLAIPVSSVIDATVYHVIFKDMKLAGVLLIFIGFMIVLLPDNWTEYLAEMLRKRIAKMKRKDKKNGKVQDTTTGQMSRLRTSSGRIK